MNKGTRDNLIYLSVAFGIVAIVVADFFYADSQGQRMWWPSRFAARAVSSTILLVYLVVRETRKANASALQVLACVLFASIVQCTTMFAFRQLFSQLSILFYSVLIGVEFLIIVLLSVWVVQHLNSSR